MLVLLSYSSQVDHSEFAACCSRLHTYVHESYEIRMHAYIRTCTNVSCRFQSQMLEHFSLRQCHATFDTNVLFERAPLNIDTRRYTCRVVSVYVSFIYTSRCQGHFFL